jgi:hypothetical protein
MKQNPGLAIVLGCMVGLSACGGSQGTTVPTTPPDSSNPPPQSPPQGSGTVAVEIVTVSGTPIPGVDVGVCAGPDCQTFRTDADGRAEFSKVRVGHAGVDAGGPGYHYAWRDIVVEKEKTTKVTMAIARAVEATPVVIATDARPSDDGQTLTVDVDLAVLGEDGLPIPTFTVVDFHAPSSDCGFGWCVMDESGAPLGTSSYTGEFDPDAFSWHEAPAAAPQASATALLLEHSTNTVAYDPLGQRADAVHAFLEAVTAPDTVALASYRGTPQSPILSIYGAFTPDGASFHDDVDALASRDANLNPLHPALTGLLSWSASQTAVTEPRSIVLLSSSWSWPDDNCGNSWDCRHKQRVAIADSARALGIPIVAIGGNDPTADIAARSGGSFVVITDPAQYAVTLENLKPIVSRQLGFNRLRLVLSSNPQVFASGHTVWSWTGLQITPDTHLYFPVVITIP